MNVDFDINMNIIINISTSVGDINLIISMNTHIAITGIVKLIKIVCIIFIIISIDTKSFK